MGCYGDDRNQFSLGAIIPENPVGAGCLLLDIGLKDLFSFRSFQRAKFVGTQGRMAQVAFKKPQTFSDSLKGISFGGISLDLLKVCAGRDLKRGFLFGGLSPPNKTNTPLCVPERLCGDSHILDKSAVLLELRMLQCSLKNPGSR